MNVVKEFVELLERELKEDSCYSDFLEGKHFLKMQVNNGNIAVFITGGFYVDIKKSPVFGWRIERIYTNPEFGWWEIHPSEAWIWNC